MLLVARDALLTGAAFAAGLLNSVAGGGSFISFPALLLTGIPPVVANATSSVAVWPGSVASMVAYRKDMTQRRALLWTLGAASLVGGGAGGLLLLHTPEVTFVRLIPWLLLVAATVFTFGPRLTAGRAAGEGSLVMTGLGQLAISIYGGYFGAGMGILMLAVYALYGMTNIHAMNGLKNLCATLINGVAVAAFIVAGAVAWHPALVMVAGAILGGYLGAAVARRISPKRVRALVVVVAWSMTGYFFWKQLA